MKELERTSMRRLRMVAIAAPLSMLLAVGCSPRADDQTGQGTTGAPTTTGQAGDTGTAGTTGTGMVGDTMSTGTAGRMGQDTMTNRDTARRNP